MNTVGDKYNKLRIDHVPECSDDEDEDTFLGKNTYRKHKSPANFDLHLEANDENMVHFNALAKYYGVSSYLIKMPES